MVSIYIYTFILIACQYGESLDVLAVVSIYIKSETKMTASILKQEPNT